MPSIKIEFTPKLLETLTFDKQVVGVTPTGRPKLVDRPDDVSSWWIRDSRVNGLMLRLTEGSTTWIVRRKMGGKVKPRAMGHYWLKKAAEDLLTLDQARERAHIWLGLMAQGIDPLQVKKSRLQENALAEERAQLTLGVAMRRYIEATQRKAKAGTTDDREKVEKWMHRAPIWSVPVAELNRDHVEGALGPLLRRALGERVAHPGWGPKGTSAGSFKKVYAWCAAAWTRGARTLGLPSGRGEGPFAMWRADQKWPKGKRKGDEVLLDTESVTGKAWLQNLVRLQAEAHNPDILTNRPDPRSKEMKPHTGVLLDYYLVVLIIGTRKTETALLRWSDVDFEKRLIRLDEENTKSGALGVVPMTEWVEQILRARRAFNERWRPDHPSPYVFPSRIHGKPISNPGGVLTQLQELTGLKVRTHDLRHTMATAIGSEADLKKAAALALASIALHHGGKGRAMIGGATPLYLHQQAEALRDIFQRREDKLRAIAGLDVPERQQEDPTDAFIDQIVDNPELQRRFFERMAGKK